MPHRRPLERLPLAFDLRQPIRDNPLPQLMAMAHSCGAKVVIEGVETVAQAKSLTEFGEVFAQGYFWHRPMDSGEATRLVEDELELREHLEQMPRRDVAARMS